LSALLLLALLGAPSALAADAGEPRPDLADPRTRATAQLDVLEGLIEAKMIDQALVVARDLREAGMKEPRLDVLQARAMHARGMDSDAVRLLEEVVSRQPRNADAWAEIGLIRADAKELDIAIAAYQKAARYDQRSAHHQNNLGFLLYARGDYKEAVEAYRAAILLDPSDVRTRNNLGFALARLENDREALEAFRSANDEADARYNLGVACDMRHDRASAINNYQAALAARPGHVQAQNALQALLSAESP